MFDIHGRVIPVDDTWCYPPHQDKDWRLCARATNNWIGTIETMAGDEIMDLSAWATRDFTAAFAYAKKTVYKHNDDFGIELSEYN